MCLAAVQMSKQSNSVPDTLLSCSSNYFRNVVILFVSHVEECLTQLHVISNIN
jgi:hypothetical protein